MGQERVQEEKREKGVLGLTLAPIQPRPQAADTQRHWGLPSPLYLWGAAEHPSKLELHAWDNQVCRSLSNAQLTCPQRGAPRVLGLATTPQYLPHHHCGLPQSGRGSYCSALVPQRHITQSISYRPAN